MPTPSREQRAISRAEARRRARLAARGERPNEDDQPPSEDTEEPRRGFLARLFPPAPPLPDKPDPLAGFEPSGPLRPIRERAFLLRRNWLAWILAGLGSFVGYVASAFYGTTILGFVGTFLMFGSLIAAGWFGWQRPTLFGTAASVLAYVLVTALVLIQLGQAGVGPDDLAPAQVVTDLTLRGLYQAGLGFLGGWYGGYLRRRQAHQSRQTGDKRRRR